MPAFAVPSCVCHCTATGPGLDGSGDGRVRLSLTVAEAEPLAGGVTGAGLVIVIEPFAPPLPPAVLWIVQDAEPELSRTF